MTELSYPVLLAPQTDTPIYAADRIVVAGRAMSAASALTRYSEAELASFGFRLPGVDDIRATARQHVITAAGVALTSAAAGYQWPEAAAWIALEQQARAYLADPAAGAGPDLAADVGDTSDAALVAARAAIIVDKADTFRDAAGAIKRARREGIAAVDAAADVAAVHAAAAAAVQAVAGAAG
jgi:hypothetical protein